MRALLLFALLASTLGPPSAVAAQERRFAVQALVGSGISIGDGGNTAVVRHSPLFLDLGLVTWSELDDAWWFGGGARVEVDGRASVAASLRIGLSGEAGPLTARPFAGLTAFFAPFTLVGAEAGVDLSLPVLDAFALFARVFADAFFAGSDLPEGGVLVMVNGAGGVEARF